MPNLPFTRRFRSPFWTSTDRKIVARGRRRWSTSSGDGSTDTSPGELRGLSEHIDSCRRMRGRMFRELSYADSVKQFLAGRIISILVVVLLAGLVALTLW